MYHPDGFIAVTRANRIHSHPKKCVNGDGFEAFIEVELENGELYKYRLWKRKKTDLISKLRKMEFPMSVAGVAVQPINGDVVKSMMTATL